MTTLAAVQDAWLFTRGAESVRIIRTTDARGAMRLVVRGPEHGNVSYEVADLLHCSIMQSEIERQLVADGYTLHQFAADHRRGRRDRRSVPRSLDRRRSLRAV